MIYLSKESSDFGACDNIIPALSDKIPLRLLSIIFELLAKTLTIKTLLIHNHLKRHAINVRATLIWFQLQILILFFFDILQQGNIKRDLHGAARNSQHIQKVLKALGLKDRILKAAKGTLVSKSSSYPQGFILASPNKLFFFSESSFGFKKKYIRIFLKDISNVTAYGEKLSIFVTGDQVKETKSWAFDKTKLGFFQAQIHTAAPKLSAVTSPSSKHDFEHSFKSLGSTASPVSTARNQTNSNRIAKQRPKDPYMNISDYGMTPHPGYADRETANICIHFSLEDANDCAQMKNIISDCINEIKKSMLSSIRPGLGAYACNQREDEYEGDPMFGYLMPGELYDDEAQETINQIFMHAKSHTYNHGHEIVCRGCVERKLYHIVSGTATLTSDAGHVTARLGAGEVFGESAFLELGDAGVNATVVAEGVVECLVVTRDTIEMMGELHPAAASRFWRSRAVAAAFLLRARCLTMQKLTETESIERRTCSTAAGKDNCFMQGHCEG